ncbi:universal stress protein [Arthrobacter sp. 35W]|uniref:universal stress protein n=1 Tax=Arthrobacter sp. 35W TaxID=1132441 RepID=UPI00042A441D|nr:universal stress protein [Arthrobacter sp. 35W]
MDGSEASTPFTGAPIIAGVIPGQDPAVWERALELAAGLSVPLIAAFVDPASYLIEWTPGHDVLPASLAPDLDPDDETVDAAAELKVDLAEAAAGYATSWSFRVVGGDPALALGRLATAVGASMIVVGTRHHGFLAKVDELVSGSLVHRLLTTQHTPVLGVPSRDTHPRFHSHG